MENHFLSEDMVTSGSGRLRLGLHGDEISTPRMAFMSKVTKEVRLGIQHSTNDE